jgi:hypothetical protein
MGVMDRIRDQDQRNSKELQTDTLEQGSQSSTLVAADPVTKRITGLLQGLSNMYSQWKDTEKDFLIRQMKIILDAIVEEIVEDDRQIFATQTAQLMILNFSKLLEFCVDGDFTRLPPELLPIACQIEGLEYDPTMAENMADSPLLALPASMPPTDAE